MSHRRRLNEITDALDGLRAALDAVVDHLDARQHVRLAVDARQERAQRSRIEIGRSLGQIHADGDGRR